MKISRYIWDVLALGIAICVSGFQVFSQSESHKIVGLIPFVSLAPLFAVFQKDEYSRIRMHISSLIVFTAIGVLIAIRFRIGLIFGAGAGVFQGVVLPLIMDPVFSQTTSLLRRSLVVLCAWVSLDYLVAATYGIAVTLPIQLYRLPLLLQPISVLGASSVDALLITSNWLLGVSLGRLVYRRTGNDRSCLMPLGSWLLTLGVWLLFAWYCWSHSSDRTTTQVRVATISPGIRYHGGVSDLINMTRVAHHDGAHFIVWPEEYVYPDRIGESCEDFIRDRIVPHLNGVDAYVVVGCMQLTPSLCPTANLAVTIGPDGRILGSYGKQHPVTMIGELSCIKNGYRSYPIQNFPGLSFSTLICYDTDFEDSAATVADMGVSLILNPSEDWAAARSHFAASVFRAVENRVAIAKADWGWDSAIIQPNGVVVAMYNSLNIHREILVANVPIYPQESSTNQMRHTLFPTLCMLVCTVMVAHAVRSRRAGAIDLESDIGTRLLL